MASGTGNLPHTSMSFSPFAILTAEELNDLVDNIEALAGGSGIGDGAIGTIAIADGAITPSKLSAAGWEFLGKNKSTALQTDVVVSLAPASRRKYYQVIFNASVATGSSGGIGIRINGLNTNASYTRTLFTASGATSNNWQLGTSTSSVASSINAFGVVDIMNNSTMNGFVAMSDGTVRYGSAIAVGLPTVTSIAVACDAANLAIGSEIIVMGRDY